MPCPVCGKATTPDRTPFCSLRCKDVDLNHWFSGSYAIATEQYQDEYSDETSKPLPSDE